MKTHQQKGPPYHANTALTCAILVASFVLTVSGLMAKPRPPGPPLPELDRIYHESFDQPCRMPTNQVINPAVWAESWSGYCLDRNSSPVAPWVIPMMVTNRTLVDPTSGAIRFWYRPAFDSGSGPGNIATLLTLASGSGSTSIVWWSLVVSPDGSTVSLACQNGNELVPCLSAPVTFQAGNWVLVALGYGETNTAIFINDAMAASGGGLPAVPAQVVPFTSLIVGSGIDGQQVAAGQIDELVAFSGSNRFLRMTGSPFGLDTQRGITAYFNKYSPIAALGPITPEEEAASQTQRLASTSMRLASPSLSAPSGGSGARTFGGAFTPMDTPFYTDADLWIEMTSLTNTTGYFVVHPPAAEVANGVYDLFMTTNLGPDVPGLNLTNWLWVLRTDPGQTNLIVPDLTADGACFLLARTNDADGDGMSDAYEHLVRHTSPTNVDLPFITSQPLSQTVLGGDTVAFAVTATGAQFFTYQWLMTGAPIPGETNSSLTLPDVQLAQAGDYSVLVSTPAGFSVTSSNATLTVEDPQGVYFIPLLGPRQDYTFRSGVTYLLWYPIQFYGRTTIQGGSIIKFDTRTNASLVIMGTLVMETQPYFPGLLTSMDDDLVGEYVEASNSSPVMATNGYAYLDLTGAQDERVAVSNLRFCYADKAVTTPSGTGTLDIWDCQFIQCRAAVTSLVTNRPSCDRLHNVLFAGCSAAIQASGTDMTIAAEHVTADVTNFWDAAHAPNPFCITIALTNSIVLGNFDTPSALSTAHVAFNPTGALFQAVAAGRYYLAPDTACRQAGTPNISSRLLTEFRRKSTQPPVSFPVAMQVSGELALMPQALRYTGGSPDLGYWYDALDYTVAGLVSQGQITMSPGTAIGFRVEYSSAVPGNWTWWGFDLREGSTFASLGTQASPNVFADVQWVQEQPAAPCPLAFVPDFQPSDTDAPAPILSFRFSNIYVATDYYILWSGLHESGSTPVASPSSSMSWSLQDCSLYGGRINLGQPDRYDFPLDWVFAPGSVSWLNNLFDQVSINLDPTYYEYLGDEYALNVDLSLQARNNLFRGGGWFRLEPIPASAGNWVLKDNLFDKVVFLQDTLLPLDFDYNGYWPLDSSKFRWSGDANRLLPTNGLHEVVLPIAPEYQAGPFGAYYLSANSPLWGAGSRTPSEAGLYHYTTRVDQVKEGDEQGDHMVNIGLHYVATTSPGSSQPVDSDGDGIPDYAEDSNGNGIQEEGETAWLTPDPPPPVVGGAVILSSGNQILTGRVNIAVMAFASPSNNVATIELLDIDTSTGQTASLGTIQVGAPSTNAVFDIDTSNLRNGWHLLQVRVTDDSGGDHISGSTPNNTLSNPALVALENGIYLLNEDDLSTGWMFHLQFGTILQDGSWRVEIRDDTGALRNSFEGDIASSLTPNGTIELWDGYTDDGVGGQRLRTPADEYPGDYLDVLMFGTPAAGSPPSAASVIKYIRTRIAHRPNPRVSCVVEAPMITRTGLRSQFDPMMDEPYVGMAPFSRHFYVSRMTSDTDQTPSAEGWNYCNTPQLWTNLNIFLAGAASEKGTHLFAFSHGDKSGFGQRTWALGPGDHVDGGTLDAFGYRYFTNVSCVVTGPPPASGTMTVRMVVRRGGQTFAFIDGCNAAGFLDTLVLNPMNISHPTLQDLVTAGRFPYYGCGWTKAKQAAALGPGGFASDVLWQHSDYVGRFLQFALERDPTTGLPKWRYQQAREKARYYSNSPTTVNPWSSGWEHVGCDGLYIDE